MKNVKNMIRSYYIWELIFFLIWELWNLGTWELRNLGTSELGNFGTWELTLGTPKKNWEMGKMVRKKIWNWENSAKNLRNWEKMGIGNAVPLCHPLHRRV